jgi:hypothetical protein
MHFTWLVWGEREKNVGRAWGECGDTIGELGAFG